MIRKDNSISHQFQTLMKKSRSRSGSLLILVIVILAVAMILITSALTLTVTARSRYYNGAISSQASLTAASVAKTIASAAEIGDLSKDDLKQLVTDTQGENRVTVTKTTTGGALLVSPGLEGVEDASGNTKTSLTELKVESNADETKFIITVTTRLDAGSATEESKTSVTVFLEENIPVYPTGFGSTLNVYGDSTRMPNVNIGVNAPVDAQSNFVTFTAEKSMSYGTTVFSSDVIFTGNAEISGNPVTIGGNLVLLGSGAALRGDFGYTMPVVSATSYFLDLCDAADSGSTFWNAAGTGELIQSKVNGFSPAGILLKNASLRAVSSNAPLNTFMPLNGTIYITGSGEVKNGGTIMNIGETVPGCFTVKSYDGSMDDLITKYTAYSGAVQTSLRFIPPTSRTELMKLLFGPDYDMGYEFLSGQPLIDKLKTTQNAQMITLKSNGNAYVNVGGSEVQVTMDKPLTAAAYYIATSNVIGNPIVFDLTNNSIDLFIVGNLEIDLNNQKAAIRFIRPNGSTNIGRIIFMENDAYLTLKGSAGTNSMYGGITGLGDAARYNTNGGTPVYEGPYAGSEPYVYIYGFNNHITASTSTYLEGYVGLFGETGYFHIDTDSNNKLPLVYARFDVYTMDVFGGQTQEIPYCPGPGEGTNTAGAKINPFVISGYITN